MVMQAWSSKRRWENWSATGKACDWVGGCPHSWLEILEEKPTRPQIGSRRNRSWNAAGDCSTRTHYTERHSTCPIIMSHNRITEDETWQYLDLELDISESCCHVAVSNDLKHWDRSKQIKLLPKFWPSWKIILGCWYPWQQVGGIHIVTPCAHGAWNLTEPQIFSNFVSYFLKKVPVSLPYNNSNFIAHKQIKGRYTVVKKTHTISNKAGFKQRQFPTKLMIHWGLILPLTRQWTIWCKWSQSY